jgi:hypothetical protein
MTETAAMAAWADVVRDCAHKRAKGVTAIRVEGSFFRIVFRSFLRIRDFVVRDREHDRARLTRT